MSEDKALYPPVDPVSAGITGRCPRCGQGKMFDGFIKLPKHCRNCGLDYSFVDTGEGPAVLVMLLVGFIVVGLALWMEVTLAPPLWLHFILWIPLALALCLTALRTMKGILIALQYKHNAAEGQIDRSANPNDVASR